MAGRTVTHTAQIRVGFPVKTRVPGVRFGFVLFKIKLQGIRASKLPKQYGWYTESLRLEGTRELSRSSRPPQT